MKTSIKDQPSFNESAAPISAEYRNIVAAFGSDDDDVEDRRTGTPLPVLKYPFRKVTHLRPCDLRGAISLSPQEEHVVVLVAKGMTTSKIAWTLEMSREQVMRTKQCIRRKLGTRKLSEAAFLLRFQNFDDSENTPAQALFDQVLPELTGARILGPIIRDRDWSGLMVILADGTHANMWINADGEGDHAGWAVIEKEDNRYDV